MSKGSGLGDGLLVTGYDVSGDVGAIQKISTSKPSLNATGINSSAKERLQGAADGGIDFSVFFNDAAGQEHVVLKAAAAIEYYLYLHGSTLGNVCAMLVGLQTKYDWSRNQDGSLTGSVSGVSKGAIGATKTDYSLEWGTQITAGKITHASATSSTGEVTASSASGAAAQLQIMSLGSGAPTVLIEHSSDTTNGIDGAWATLLTFTIGAANLAERITVSGTVNKGLRATTTGVFTNLVFAIGLRRGTAVDTVAYS